MFVIGVTGGIASGKSNVVKNLANLGARVLDADLIGHSVYAPKTKGFHEVLMQLSLTFRLLNYLVNG